jgi:hypothetical protein
MDGLHNVLTPLHSSLAPHALAVGFKPTEQVLGQGLGWLEYRAADEDGSVLLQVFHTPAKRTITVEVWRPELLPKAMQAGDPQAAVELRLAWVYGQTVDPARVGREICETVSRWLANRCCPSAH